MNFRAEPRFMQNENLTDAEQTAYDRLVMKMNKEAIRMDDFESVYPKTEINHDKVWMENIKRKDGFDAVTERGELLEALLYTHIEKANWLGEDAHTIKTCKYDDIKNGTDFVIEFENDGEPIRIAVDVTVSGSDLGLDKKMNRILGDLDKAQGTELRYFQSEGDEKNEPYMGPVRDLPKVILAFDYQNTAKLAEIELKLSKGLIKPADVAEDEVQFDIQESIIEQLKGYIDRMENKYEDPSPFVIYKNIKAAIAKMESVIEIKSREA